MFTRAFWWLKQLLTLAVLATVVFAGYEYYAIRAEGYPREMHLIDRQYRVIPIRLEGRNATHLHATRRDTGRFFTYEIKDLHLINQWRMHLYPVASKIDGAIERSNSNTHAEQTLAARDRLIEATKKLQTKIEDAESDSLRRSLEQEVARKLQNIRNLETNLERYDIDYQTYDHTQSTGSLVEQLSDLIDRIVNRNDLSTK